MARAFPCRSCGEEIITVYLNPGEEAACKKCGAKTPVPEEAREVEAPTHLPAARLRQTEEARGGEILFTIGGVLSEAFAVLANNTAPLLLIAFLVYLPMLFFNILSSTMTPTGESLGTYIVVMFLTLGAHFFLVLVMQGAVIYGVFQYLRDLPVSVGQCLRVAVRRIGPLILVSLLVGLAVMVGAVFLVVPGIILSCMFWVAVPVVVVERLGATKAMSRSMDLTKNRLWRIFGLTIVIGLIGGLGSLVAGCIAGPITMSNQQAGVIIGGFLTYAISGVVGALSAVANSVGYYFLRVEKGGIDLGDLLRVFE